MEFIREKQTSIVALLTRLKVDIWYEHIYSTQPELSFFATFVKIEVFSQQFFENYSVGEKIIFYDCQIHMFSIFIDSSKEMGTNVVFEVSDTI